MLRVRDVMKATELPCCARSQNGLAALVQLAVRATPSARSRAPASVVTLRSPCAYALAARAQGSSKGCGCLLVVDDAHVLLGTLSDGDLRRALAASGEAALGLTVSELMNFNKPFPRTVCPDDMARARTPPPRRPGGPALCHTLPRRRRHTRRWCRWSRSRL